MSHCFCFVFQLFDREGKGSLSAEELSNLLGALLGFPQRTTAELYTQASNQGQLTEGEGLLSNELSITNLKILSGLSGKPPGTSLH